MGLFLHFLKEKLQLLFNEKSANGSFNWQNWLLHWAAFVKVPGYVCYSNVLTLKTHILKIAKALINLRSVVQLIE